MHTYMIILTCMHNLLITSAALTCKMELAAKVINIDRNGPNPRALLKTSIKERHDYRYTSAVIQLPVLMFCVHCSSLLHDLYSSYFYVPCMP